LLDLQLLLLRLLEFHIAVKECRDLLRVFGHSFGIGGVGGSP
jgi:hypothetical protein